MYLYVSASLMNSFSSVPGSVLGVEDVSLNKVEFLIEPYVSGETDNKGKKVRKKKKDKC